LVEFLPPGCWKLPIRRHKHVPDESLNDLPEATTGRSFDLGLMLYKNRPDFPFRNIKKHSIYTKSKRRAKWILSISRCSKILKQERISQKA